LPQKGTKAAKAKVIFCILWQGIILCLFVAKNHSVPFVANL